MLPGRSGGAWMCPARGVFCFQPWIVANESDLSQKTEERREGVSLLQPWTANAHAVCVCVYPICLPDPPMPVSFIVSGFVLSGVLSLCTQPGFKGHPSLRWKAPELLKSVLYPPVPLVPVYSAFSRVSRLLGTLEYITTTLKIVCVG